LQLRRLPLVLAVTGLAIAAAVLVWLALQPGRQPRTLVVGGVEDAGKWADPAGNMELARRAGFKTIVLSSVWQHGLSAPSGQEAYRLRNAIDCADAAGITPVVAIYSFARDTPLSPQDRAAFTDYAVSLVEQLPELRYVSLGNEPNSNVFWMPQFGLDGRDVAAQAYFDLLSTAYPAVKQASPGITVIGMSLAARGNDRPRGKKQTHSPTRFIDDFGAAFRASGLKKPPFDLFSIHPYPPNSSVPPTATDPHSTSIGIADYPKLVGLLAGAFGAPPPIVYGEYGIQTEIPRAELSLYSGVRAPSIHPVSEARQANDYVEAIHLAACQPLVRMLIFFHVTDESAFTGLQTGLYYPNGQPKTSLPRVAASAQAAEKGQLKCSS
jgi:hypothetical protein